MLKYCVVLYQTRLAVFHGVLLSLLGQCVITDLFSYPPLDNSTGMRTGCHYYFLKDRALKTSQILNLRSKKNNIIFAFGLFNKECKKYLVIKKK